MGRAGAERGKGRELAAHPPPRLVERLEVVVVALEVRLLVHGPRAEGDTLAEALLDRFAIDRKVWAGHATDRVDACDLGL